MERGIVRYELLQTMMLCVGGTFGPNFERPFPARKPFSVRKWSEMSKFPYIEQEMSMVLRIMIRKKAC